MEPLENFYNGCVIFLLLCSTCLPAVSVLVIIAVDIRFIIFEISASFCGNTFYMTFEINKRL